MSSSRQICVFPSPAELALSVSQLLVHESQGTCSFRLALSGGSLVQLLSRELPKTAGLNTAGWKVAFCDERLVPFSDPESTYGEYKRQLVPLGLLSESQFVIIDPTLPVEEAAVDYTKKLQELFPGDDLPVFDLVILGIGPDGHTASLFPGHPLLQVTDKVVAPISDSPKPPPERVTLTLPVINAAKMVVFVATGEGKATILKEHHFLFDGGQRVVGRVADKAVAGPGRVEDNSGVYYREMNQTLCLQPGSLLFMGSCSGSWMSRLLGS